MTHGKYLAVFFLVTHMDSFAAFVAHIFRFFFGIFQESLKTLVSVWVSLPPRFKDGLNEYNRFNIYIYIYVYMSIYIYKKA